MRVMGLDYGKKTIGVAVSDLLKMTAQGKEVIKRTSKKKDMKRLKELVENNKVEKIVVGLPINMNGTKGPRAEKTLKFVDRLERHFSIPIETWDERLSTMEAERTLIQGDVSRKKRKKVIDKMAAVIILQGYLDRHYR